MLSALLLAEESLSTNQQVGLALMTAAFVAFALTSSFVLPKLFPGFPRNRRGVAMFSLVAFAFFAGQMLAVIYI